MGEAQQGWTKDGVPFQPHMPAVEEAEATAREARVELLAESLGVLAELKEIGVIDGANSGHDEFDFASQWPENLARG